MSSKRKNNNYWKTGSGKNDKCGACNGSGYYDVNNSPKCESCNGTGKEKGKL